MKMLSTPNRLVFVVMAAWVGGILGVMAGEASAMNAETCQAAGQGSNKPDSGSMEVTVGFRGQVRLGHWTPIHIRFSDRSTADSVKVISITCPDGDDVPTTYEVDPVRDEQDPAKMQGWFRVGRTRGSLNIQALSAGGEVLGEWTAEIGNQPGATVQTVSSTARLVLHIGRLGNSLPQPKQSTGRQNLYPDLYLDPVAIDTLPLDWMGYRSLDTVVLGVESTAFLDELGDQRRRALMQWVERGGNLVYWVEADALGSLQTGGALYPLSRFEAVREARVRSSSRLESFVNSPTPLLTSNADEMAVLAGIGNTSVPLVVQDDVVLISRTKYGFGIVTFVGFSMVDPPLTNWAAAGTLLEDLVNPGAFGSERVSSMMDVQASRNGYLDLAGQLRVPLEQFRTVGLIPFTAVALLIALFLLMVGPGDYWLLRSMGKRMHWTWLTFPLVAVLFSGLAYWLNQVAKPPRRQVNQLEIVDIDLVSKRVQARYWGSLYSPESAQSDLQLDSEGAEVGDLDYTELSWMGQPGIGLGGMQTTTPVLTIVNGYRHQVTAGASTSQVQLLDFPTAVASVRTLSGGWSGNLQVDLRSRLRINRRIDRIDGDFTNAFDFPLIKPRLFYRGSVYFIERDLAPGDSMDLFTEAKERTVKSFITRRTRVANDDSQSVPWNQADTDIARIGEMIMFHNLAGGASYTGLSNRYLTGVEFSQLVLPNQAILLAEVPRHFSVLRIDGEAVSNDSDKSTTLIRIVLPVETETGEGRR